MMRILLASCILTLGCSDASNLLVPIPPDLLNSPSTITVDGTPVTLGASVTANPRLHLTGVLGTTNLSPWPTSANAGRVWVVHRGVAWSSATKPDPLPLPLRFGAIAVVTISDGPTWTVGDSVDVIMEVLDGHGSTQRLRAARTVIASGT